MGLDGIVRLMKPQDLDASVAIDEKITGALITEHHAHETRRLVDPAARKSDPLGDSATQVRGAQNCMPREKANTG